MKNTWKFRKQYQVCGWMRGAGGKANDINGFTTGQPRTIGGQG